MIDRNMSSRILVFLYLKENPHYVTIYSTPIPLGFQTNGDDYQLDYH